LSASGEPSGRRFYNEVRECTSRAAGLKPPTRRPSGVVPDSRAPGPNGGEPARGFQPAGAERDGSLR
jgi:hypothetical protein